MNGDAQYASGYWICRHNCEHVSRAAAEECSGYRQPPTPAQPDKTFVVRMEFWSDEATTPEEAAEEFREWISSGRRTLTVAEIGEAERWEFGL